MTTEPQLGDTVIVTDPSCDLTYGRECWVNRVDAIVYVLDPSVDYIWVVRKGDPGEFQLAPGQYELLEEVGEKVLVGDRIIITNKSWEYDYLKIFVVLEVREKNGISNEDCILVTYEDKNEDPRDYRLTYDTFMLLKRKSEASPSCPDCKGTGKILLLTSIIECSCKEIGI